MKSAFIKSTIFSVSIVFTGAAIAVDENAVNNVIQEVKEKTMVSGDHLGIYGVHLGMTYGEAKAHALKTARYPDERKITKSIRRINYDVAEPNLRVSMGFENTLDESPARDINITRQFGYDTDLDRDVLAQDLINKFGEPAINGGNRNFTFAIPGPGQPEVRNQCSSELAKSGLSRLQVSRALPRGLTNIDLFGYETVRAILTKCPSAIDTYKAFVISQLAPRMEVNLNGGIGKNRQIVFRMFHRAPQALDGLEAIEAGRKAREAKGPARL